MYEYDVLIPLKTTHRPVYTAARIMASIYITLDGLVMTYPK